MANKQTKRKSQTKTRGRKKNVKLSNLPVAASGAVKGGGSKTATTTTSGGTYMTYGSISGDVTSAGFEKWIE